MDVEEDDDEKKESGKTDASVVTGVLTEIGEEFLEIIADIFTGD